VGGDESRHDRIREGGVLTEESAGLAVLFRQLEEGDRIAAGGGAAVELDCLIGVGLAAKSLFVHLREVELGKGVAGIGKAGEDLAGDVELLLHQRGTAHEMARVEISLSRLVVDDPPLFLDLFLGDLAGFGSLAESDYLFFQAVGHLRVLDGNAFQQVDGGIVSATRAGVFPVVFKTAVFASLHVSLLLVKVRPLYHVFPACRIASVGFSGADGIIWGMSYLIRTTSELESACAQVREAGVLALDTEFVWRNTYRPRLGIVQMGAGGDLSWAIDVMQDLNAAALAELIADASVVKVLHDARQDLQHLRHYCGAFPQNVFDTQLAAAFAGFPQGHGLQKLLLEAVDVGLPKTETCTDWTQRPLSEAQVRYALDDIRHLPALRTELLRRAEAFGTRTWLEEELTKYDEPSLYADYDPEEAWKKVKLTRTRLDRRGFAVLRALAATREELAQEWNLPRNWAGDDASLAQMAEARTADLLRHRMNNGKASLARGRYAAAIAAAEALPEEECPEDPRRHYIPEVRDAADKALNWLDVRAEELHVAAGTIANRATVTAFVDNVDDGSNPLANGWRWDVVGSEMAELFGVE